MSDIPLEPLPEPYGNIVDIGDFRIRNGKTPWRREKEICKHKHLIINTTERRIWCEDCSANVDAFDAVRLFHAEWGKLSAAFASKHAKAEAAMASSITRRAAKEFDRAWAGKMAPCCPHCKRGLMPHDFSNGAAATVGFEYENARRLKDKK